MSDMGSYLDDDRTTCLIYEFDYQAVESASGLERHDVMALVNEFDNKMNELHLGGALDISFILAEAVTGVVSEIKLDGTQQLVSTDYYTLFYDILSNDEELYESIDDISMSGANMCFKLHNLLVIGFTALMDHEERLHLASVLGYRSELLDINEKFQCVELTEDSIIITCPIPEELDEYYEDDDAIQKLHSHLIARINRALSRSTRRG